MPLHIMDMSMCSCILVRGLTYLDLGLMNLPHTGHLQHAIIRHTFLLRYFHRSTPRGWGLRGDFRTRLFSEHWQAHCVPSCVYGVGSHTLQGGTVMAGNRSKATREYPVGFELSNEQWVVIVDHFPEYVPSEKGGSSPVPPRPCLEGIIWILRTGA